MNVRTGFLPVVLALSIGGVSAACSTTTSSTATARVNRRSTTTTTTLQPTAAGLHNELLTRSSVPASWSVTSQPGTFSLACLTDAKVVADSRPPDIERSSPRSHPTALTAYTSVRSVPG